MNKLTLLLTSVLLTSCANMGVLIGVSDCVDSGIGVDYSSQNGYIYKVFKPSPALTAGVKPGGVIMMHDGFPPKGEKGDVVKFKVKYYENPKTAFGDKLETIPVEYEVTLGRFCVDEYVEPEKLDWDDLKNE